MRYLLHFAILFIFLVSCSNQNTPFTVVCGSLDGSSFTDKSLTFDLKSNKVTIREILNAYGYEAKNKFQAATQSESAIEQFGEEKLNEYLGIFDDKEYSNVIRNIDEGFITFGATEEKGLTMDVEQTFDRANLSLKMVLYNAYAADYGNDTEMVSYYDCKIPAV